MNYEGEAFNEIWEDACRSGLPNDFSAELGVIVTVASDTGILPANWKQLRTRDAASTTSFVF